MPLYQLLLAVVSGGPLCCMGPWSSPLWDLSCLQLFVTCSHFSYVGLRFLSIREVLTTSAIGYLITAAGILVASDAWDLCCLRYVIGRLEYAILVASATWDLHRLYYVEP